MEVALIGKGVGKQSAPLKGDGITTWGVNDVVAHRECDVCFWMDKHLMQGTQMDELVKSSVNHTHTPTYCVEHFGDIPTSVPYPFDDVVSFFGTDYFADSCCYMVALAIYQGFDKISLYGFNYAWGENYGREKPAVSFWLGVAVGFGVQVEVNGEHSELLVTPDGNVYSYLTPQRSRLPIKIEPKAPHYEGVVFSIADRIVLSSLLPKVGSYKTVKFSRWMRDKLFFSAEESKVINLRRADNSQDSPWIWDDNKLPDKEIKLTKSEFAFIASLLNRLDKTSAITYDNISLFEKFCIGSQV